MSTISAAVAAPATIIIEVAVQKVYTEARHNCYLFRVPADTDNTAFELSISDHADDLWESVFIPGQEVCGGTYIAEYESETHTDEWQEPSVCEVGRPQCIPSDAHVFLLRELVEGFALSELDDDDEVEARKLKEFRAGVKELASKLDSRGATDEHRKSYREYVLLQALTRHTGYKDFRGLPVRVINSHLTGEYEQVKDIFGIKFESTATVKKPGAKF